MNNIFHVKILGTKFFIIAKVIDGRFLVFADDYKVREINKQFENLKITTLFQSEDVEEVNRVYKDLVKDLINHVHCLNDDKMYMKVMIDVLDKES